MAWKLLTNGFWSIVNTDIVLFRYMFLFKANVGV